MVLMVADPVRRGAESPDLQVTSVTPEPHPPLRLGEARRCKLTGVFKCHVEL